MSGDMDSEYQENFEPKKTISDFSYSDSLPSIESLGPDSLTGWTNHKPGLLGLCSEKPTPSLQKKNKNQRGIARPPRKPSTLSSLPNSEDISPSKPSYNLKRRGINCKEIYNGKSTEQDKVWLSPIIVGTFKNRRHVKTKSTSFSKERGRDSEIPSIWIEEEENQEYGNEYGIKAGSSKLLLKPGDAWGNQMKADSFGNKIIDHMELYRNPNSNKVEMATPRNFALYPTNASRYKQQNHSFNNANLNFVRKTFMGISMFATKSISPIQKETVSTLENSLLMPKKRASILVLNRETHANDLSTNLTQKKPQVESKTQIEEMIEVKKPAIHARSSSTQYPKPTPLKDDKLNTLNIIKKVDDEQSFDAKESRDYRLKSNKEKLTKVAKLKEAMGGRPPPKSAGKSPGERHIKPEPLPKVFEVVGGKLVNLKSFY